MNELWRVEQGDCVELMARMPEASVDATVTDPPYGIGFMNKGWDRPSGSEWGYWAGSGKRPSSREAETFYAFSLAWGTEALRVLKPGGHLLAFGGTRTHHRLYCAVEDAGFEIRDTMLWLYAQGFPKSKNLDGDSKGWGTALKPAWEPIILARKPLSEKNVAANVLRWGTGALNIDGCRIGRVEGDRAEYGVDGDEPSRTGKNTYGEYKRVAYNPHGEGRWPANVVLDEEAAALVDAQSGERPGTRIEKPSDCATDGATSFDAMRGSRPPRGYKDSGGASRFFYVAKASRSEREAGLEGIEKRPGGSNAKGYTEDVAHGQDRNRPVRNDHPTVKPVALMQWLCRLVTPPGGVVLDPFTGSGSTGIAALREGFRFIGIEKDGRYCEIARRRIEGDAPLFQWRGGNGP